MVIGPTSGNNNKASDRESSDTLSELEHQVRSIEVNTLAARLKDDESVTLRRKFNVSNVPTTNFKRQLMEQKPNEMENNSYLRYQEHEDLIDTVNHEPER